MGMSAKNEEQEVILVSQTDTAVSYLILCMQSNHNDDPLREDRLFQRLLLGLW